MKDKLIILGDYAELVSNIKSLSKSKNYDAGNWFFYVNVYLKDTCEKRAISFESEESRETAFKRLVDTVNIYRFDEATCESTDQIEPKPEIEDSEVEMAAPKLRRRKSKGEGFYAIEVDSHGEFIVIKCLDNYDERCNSHFINFNYYWTEEECKEAIIKLSRLRKSSHPDYPSDQN